MVEILVMALHPSQLDAPLPAGRTRQEPRLAATPSTEMGKRQSSHSHAQMPTRTRLGRLAYRETAAAGERAALTLLPISCCAPINCPGRPSRSTTSILANCG